MAKDKTGSGDKTPSADEIIEALALEMGVDGDKKDDEEKAEDKSDETSGAEAEADAKDAAEDTSDGEGESADEGGADADGDGDGEAEKAEPAETAEKSGEEADGADASSDTLASVGGIFDVPGSSSKKKTKKKTRKKKEPASMAEGQEKPALPKNKEAGVAAIDSIFDINEGRAREPLSTPIPDDSELDELEGKARGGTNKLLIGVIVLLVLALGVVSVFATGKSDDVIAVFNGTYRDRKDAEKRKIEEEWKRQQLEALEKYGNLNITGSPNHAVVLMQLEGDTAAHVLYAQYAEDSPYTEIRLPAIIQGLKIKKPIQVNITAPGYKPDPYTITFERWQETALGEYQYVHSANLLPESDWHRDELADRLLPFEDEDPPGGSILVSSNPPGAKIMLNKRLVVDKSGNPVLTPATLTEVPTAPEDEGADKKKKPEPKPIKINTPPDSVGYKVLLFFDDETKPKYETYVFREFWNCEKKDDKELSKLKKDARPALQCNYTYKVHGDFPAISVEIDRQKKIQEELKKQKEDQERIQREAEERLKKL